MAVSGKYGKVSMAKVGEHEPVFILRAQGKLAEAAVEMYKILVASHGSSMAPGIEKEIEVFRHWSGPKKIPD